MKTHVRILSVIEKIAYVAGALGVILTGVGSGWGTGSALEAAAAHSQQHHPLWEIICTNCVVYGLCLIGASVILMVGISLCGAPEND